jgi:hypothetical protein
MRAWRANNPILAMYTTLKCNAKRRGKDFTLTFEEWDQFVKEHKMLENRGTEPQSLTVDRIDPTRGYSIDNIRPLSHIENSTRQDDPF